jgi:hypothetical protein
VEEEGARSIILSSEDYLVGVIGMVNELVSLFFEHRHGLRYLTFSRASLSTPSLPKTMSFPHESRPS